MAKDSSRCLSEQNPPERPIYLQIFTEWLFHSSNILSSLLEAKLISLFNAILLCLSEGHVRLRGAYETVSNESSNISTLFSLGGASAILCCFTSQALGWGYTQAVNFIGSICCHFFFVLSFVDNSYRQSKNKNPGLGNSIPVLGMKPKGGVELILVIFQPRSMFSHINGKLSLRPFE